MKKLFLFVLISLVIIPVLGRANLSISSFYVLFDANSPKRTDIIRVSNSSNTRKTYRIRMINYKQNVDGTYTEISEPIKGNPFASPYIGFSPHETTLEPGQPQTVRLVRKPMAAAPDGEYVSHLLIQEMPEKRQTTPTTEGALKIDIKALYGISIPVIIDKGDLSSSAVIEKASLFANAKYPYAEVTVKRSGTRSFWGNLIVMVNNKEVGRVNGFKIFLTTPERRIKIPLTGELSSRARIILEDARTHAVIAEKNI